MDSGVIKELSIKISSHPERPKLKGVYLLVEEERVEMDNMKSNYMKVSNIQEELKNVVIENYLEFENTGKYEFRKCEDCNGPMIGYLRPVLKLIIVKMRCIDLRDISRILEDSKKHCGQDRKRR